MKTCNYRWLILLVVVMLISACVPLTYSIPMEIHVDSGDRVEQAVVAVDAAGLSHIAGVVDDRIVYYRTRYGDPLATFTMTMGTYGTDWKQYDPDIAVLDNGTAYIVWVEQHGGPEKYACYRNVPLVPPVGGYENTCIPLNGSSQTTGNVLVEAWVNLVYVVYDQAYTNGRIAALFYKDFTHSNNQGLVYDYISQLETSYIYGMDLVIDQNGGLHVAILDNYTVTGAPPYTDRLMYRSNVSVDALGNMSQGWTIITGVSLGEDVDPSISIFEASGEPRVGIASIWTPTGVDHIYIDSCAVDGCHAKSTYLVGLPSSWNTNSIIDDLEILGRDEVLFLGFIGDNSTTNPPQVYYTNAFDTSLFLEPSDGSATFKFDLEMVMVEPRPESTANVNVPVLAWAESNFVTATHYVAGYLTPVVKIEEDNCPETLASGNIGSNGSYLSGVWDACSNTWFTTQAWMTDLPLLLK